MSRRSYNQYCAIARALDVVGERWTLLIIRELLTGPKRYSDLLEHLPGLSTNLLADRLKYLDEEGLIRQATLPPPAASAVYELTDRGRSLEPALLSLAEWGRPLLAESRPGDEFSVTGLMLAMKRAFQPETTKSDHLVIEYRVEGEVFQVRVDDGVFEIQQGTGWKPDVSIATDNNTLRQIAAGQLSGEDALNSERVSLGGDRSAFLRTFAMFGIDTGD